MVEANTQPGVRREPSDSELLHLLVGNAPIGLLILDAEGVTTRALGSAWEDAGVDTRQLLGRSFTTEPGERRGDETDGQLRARSLTRIVRAALGGRTMRFDFPSPKLGKHYEAHFEPIHAAADGPVTGVLGIIIDVTARAKAEEALRLSISRDPLTGLSTISAFSVAAQEILDQPETRRAALIVIRGRQLRYLTSLFGVEFGQTLERQMADSLSQMAPGDSLVGRVGSGEFALFVPGATAQSAVDLAHSLCQRVGRGSDAVTFHIQETAGVALYPQHGTTIERLRGRAASAERHAEGQHEAVHIFTEPEEARAKRDLSIAVDLVRALESQAFSLAFQPIVDARTRKLVSAEALLRWTHPTKGAMSPALIVPLAEELGFAKLLADRVVDGALEAVVAWRAHGVDASVSVNISQELFDDSALPGRLALALHTWNLDPDALEVELTESTFRNQSSRANEVIAELRRTGIRVALDDFGTGYAPLSLLNDLTIDSLKIDRSFISAIAADDPRSSAVAQSLMVIGDRLGLATTAEGVESEAVGRMLTDAGCTRLQGYAIARPMPLEQLIADWAPAG